MSISVKNENPKLAKELADTVREVASVQIKDITYADSVNTVEEGNLPKSPSSPNTMKNAMFGGILGVLIAFAVIIVRYVLDDSIKTPDDVEHYLELTVLSSIPVASDTSDIKEIIKRVLVKQVFRRNKEQVKKGNNTLQVELKDLEKDYRSHEAYKMLRTNIEFSGEKNKVLVFTSCTPGEGKKYGVSVCC